MKQEHPFFKQYNEKVLIFDGAMGTSLQNYNLTEDDFAGKDGCNEYLVETRPQIIKEVHASYFEVGCDVVETDSFGSTAIVLGEYDLQDKTYDLNVKAAQLAKEVARDFSTPDRPRLVAGSIGPTTKLPTLGHITYVDLRDAYLAQVSGLIDGGADILLVETCQDLLQTKATLSAINQVKREKQNNIPVMVQVTIEQTGTMLVGTDIASVVSAMSPFDIDVLGLNCATGPAEMMGHVRYLSHHSPFLISCLPNAGIPENVGGHAHYHLQPDQLASAHEQFVKELGVNIVGGCCGTTPAHLKAVVERVGGLAPMTRQPDIQHNLTSLYTAVPMSVEPAPVLVGERTNANGSKKFRELLQVDDYDGLVTIGKEQVKVGAHLLDVCTAYVGRDEIKDMQETIQRFVGQLDVPMMIDSTEPPVIEAALQRIAGKPIVNSINLEDGEERLELVVGLCREYGAAVVALTIDEEGMAKDVDSKVRIAQRIYDLAVNRHGMAPEDLVFDPLTFTLGSGDEEFRKAGADTIEGIRNIKNALPGVSFILGVSNISFGLNPSARHVLNSVFLHYAVEAGLDMAIINSRHLIPLHKISDEEREICRRLVFDERTFDEQGDVVSDPLIDLMAYYDKNVGSKAGSQEESMPEAIEERLKYRIVNGEKTGMDMDLSQALNDYSALEIINTILLSGMKTVGELFGAGEMQLPFVLQSAETMKTAVAYLEPHMEKSDGNSAKGTMVLATVKGDVHDIGKNLVDIILTNNGYKVVNLGIKQPVETIISSIEEHQADAVGMSGLLVKSTAIMKENLEIMRERGLATPVILGGAALTPKFVEQDCQAIYEGRVFYAKDAFSGLYAMEAIMSGEQESVSVEAPITAKVTSAIGGGEPVYQAVGDVGSDRYGGGLKPEHPDFSRRSDVASDNPILEPPFWGVKIMDNVSLDTVYPYINTQALFAGQWQVKRGKRNPKEHKAFVEQEIMPVFERLKVQAKDEALLIPKVIYGYFPCQSEGNDLIVYEEDQKAERLRFHFPRGGSKRLCISDYFASKASGRMDVLPIQLVTVGDRATDYAQTLFEKGNYTEYLYFHGFGVETAEALAEYWHQRIRQELNIHGDDAPEIRKLFSQGYQGSRFSFGYPACPNLEDQTKLCRLLQPELIGVGLSEEFMLEPEQSTSAIVVHHPEARYFDVRLNNQD